MDMSSLNQGCINPDNKHKTSNQPYSNIAMAWGYKKERKTKAISVSFPPVSLTWAAIPSLESEEAWFPWLDWDGTLVLTWLGRMHLLEPYGNCIVCFSGWDHMP